MKLEIGDLTAHQKYAREETERRLKDTRLLSRWNEVQTLLR
jgi:hypothetical protein